MRIPAFLIEHPVEAMIAGALLLALIFGPSDRHTAQASQPAPMTRAASM
jgi:hypothetical protein